METQSCTHVYTEQDPSICTHIMQQTPAATPNLSLSIGVIAACKTAGRVLVGMLQPRAEALTPKSQAKIPSRSLH